MPAHPRALAPIRVRLPDISDLAPLLPTLEINYLRELNAALQREFERRPPVETPYHELLLISPGGNVFAITVSDQGVLQTTVRFTV